MSTATAFVFPGSFPFCVSDLSGTISATNNYIGNITLADAMAFVWNLEKFYITTAGSVTNGGTTSAAGHFAMNDPTTGYNLDGSPSADASCVAGVWFDLQTTTAWASWPAIKQPVERICYAGTDGLIQSFASILSSSFYSGIDLAFTLSLDPSNSGKYRLYYNFLFEYENAADEAPAVAFANPAQNAGAVIESGTFTLGGFTFDWEATVYGVTATHSGLSMSATSGFFTY